MLIKNMELLISANDYDDIKKDFALILNNMDIREINLNAKRKYLLFINPFGGRGTAIKVWNRVKNILGIMCYNI